MLSYEQPVSFNYWTFKTYWKQNMLQRVGCWLSSFTKELSRLIQTSEFMSELNYIAQ